eukprot:Hpha_TRINITY_DN32131_c0_g1::TRINITY_DN32131_c0_g1_i1::g.18429::m.18429
MPADVEQEAAAGEGEEEVEEAQPETPPPAGAAGGREREEDGKGLLISLDAEMDKSPEAVPKPTYLPANVKADLTKRGAPPSAAYLFQVVYKISRNGRRLLRNLFATAEFAGIFDPKREKVKRVIPLSDISVVELER